MTNDNMRHPHPENALVSVVLPVFNESAILEELTTQIVSVLRNEDYEFEIVYVNDGSRDGSAELLDQLAARDPHVRIVHFSRNFGHQAAVQAGLEQARGDAIIVMDSDLQDDPRALKTFLAYWTAGYDVVYAVRTDRKENVLKRGLFSLFYRILERVSDIPIPRDAGNFGLVDRRVADLINQIEDRDRYYPGLRSWAGFRQIGIPVERAARHDDTPRVSFWQLVKLAKAAVFSFSSAPIEFFYAVAGLSTIVCAATTAFAACQWLWDGSAISGWVSLMMISSFFGALNAAGLAIIGEYIIRIYDQVRARPQFVIDQQAAAPIPANKPSDSILDWVDRSLKAGEIEESETVEASLSQNR